MPDKNNPDMIDGAYDVPEPIRTELFDHLDVNVGGCEIDWGKIFKKPSYHKRTGQRSLLKQQLADMVVYHTVSMQDFEFLTNYYFDTEEEYQDYLRNEFWPEVFPGEKPEDYCSKQDE